MTLPSGYPISQHQIEDEFGLPRGSTWPGAFYGKGGAPASGNLSFSDFFGRSNITFNPVPGTYYPSGTTSVSQGISASANVVWTYTMSVGVSASLASGSTNTGISFSMSTTTTPKTGTVNLTATVNGQTFNWTINFDLSGTG